MENIKVEKWLDNEIRFVEVNNEWWAVAGDVAKALGYKNPRATVSNKVKSEEKLRTRIVYAGQSREVTVIKTKTIYKLTFRSNLEQAEEFTDWVTDIIDSLRESVGLEQYEVFRMMDKQIQKEASRFLQDNIENAEPKHHMKAQAITNKAVSNKFGISPSIKKPDMTPDMLVARQPILNDTVELMVAKDKYNLDLSVSKTIYAKHN